MSILIFSSNQTFGEFLSQSLHESGLEAHRAVSFSEAELKLYKSEPDLAIFVDLDDGQLRKIGRAVGESCSVLVIGDTSQRSIIKAGWRFLTTQSSVTIVLAQITDFFLDFDEVSFPLTGDQSSCSLEEHFSTAAMSEPLDSNVFGRSLEKLQIGTYGLSDTEIEKLKSKYTVAGPTQTPFCDAILIRPDTTQACLNFLALSQSVLPTALVSLGASNFYQLLACSIIQIDTQSRAEINEAINATRRENGPCYDEQIPIEHRIALDSLGCRMGSFADFLPLNPKNPSWSEKINLERKLSSEIPQDALNLYSSDSDLEKRRDLWRVAARTRSLQNRNVQHLPDLLRGLAQCQSPYLLSISTDRTDSRRFISNMLGESVPLIVNVKNSLLCLCEALDLTHIELELESLQHWTGRDTQGLGWFARIQTRAYEITANTIAPILASIGEVKGDRSSFTVVKIAHERIKQ